MLYVPGDTPECCIFFVHTSIGEALSVLLYFLVILLGAIFLGTQITSLFGDQ